MDLDLQDVHVLVTGASGGIGLETARLFLQQGAKVTAHYNTNISTLHALIEEFGAQRVVAAPANLTAEVDVASLFETAGKTLGPVQIAIINHGIWPTADCSVAQMTLARWQATLDTNLTGAFLVAREYLRRLERAPDALKDKASILFVGSTAGKYGEAGHADYATSKSALMYGLTLSLKNEIVKIAPKGRVNCVSPGWVNTPMAAEALKDPEIVYRALATTPLKKVGAPFDIATQIVVLSSQKLSGHVTGQNLMVEGGMEGRLLNRMNSKQGLEAY
ncbi:NAD(P)-binding protein [Mycena alexandri]|uniref:NAD(P)-binding protein n=1 Tax=Mycena alexandri TaxID=1745969 RepID=A0AAD6X901_9AGAR|nr:NAD(P)-binding protein [Mycena alexandri]